MTICRVSLRRWSLVHRLPRCGYRPACATSSSKNTLDGVNRKPLKAKQRGALYMLVLGMLVIMSIAALHVGQSRALIERQAKEVELLFAGDQFRRAIESYARTTPMGMPRYPATFDDLLHDPRQPALKRHLRRVFHDPLNGTTDWGIVALQDGRIRGVYSKSAQAPLKMAGFAEDYATFVGAESYQDWKFVSKLP